MIDFQSSADISAFRRTLQKELDNYLAEVAEGTDLNNSLRVDLHCHDHNSDVPDELWGRILALPETWLKTKKLVATLKRNRCDVITITNHNNARSCWDLLDKGRDVLVGAEFTCYFPEYVLFVHVLAYGFDPAQEVRLNELRGNIYDFLRYTTEQDIPVILPHPLYFYTRNPSIDTALFEKLAVLFQRYEVINGQRDQWQSVLTLKWCRGLSEEKIHDYARVHGLNPGDFGVDPARPKILTGGSDDHMGLFAGECGSHLYVDKLSSRLVNSKPSELALEALRSGRVTPFGHVAENQKLNIALLDYFSQVAMRIKDPGLLRILLHRGEVSDKAACVAIGNVLLEMQKNKSTMKYFRFVHNALHGKKLNKLVHWKVKKDYRFCLKHLEEIAKAKNSSPERFVRAANRAIPDLFTELNHLVVRRLKKSGLGGGAYSLKDLSPEKLTRNFEVTSQLSRLMLANDRKNRSGMGSFNVGKLLDNLSFPFLVSLVLVGTTLASTRLLYQNREFLNKFARQIGGNRHPRRALYLTDTLLDKNGVSNSLSAKLREIQYADLPIDFLICHSDAQPAPHLHVVRPLASFSFPELGEQELRVPDLLEIARIFYEGGYDRIVCSTEGPMAPVALFIKHMFNVPSYFFMHTDWLEFVKNTTSLNHHERDRIRRILRFFYRQFSGVFVLNSEHRAWLTGHEMQLEGTRVFTTAHHVAASRSKVMRQAKHHYFESVPANAPVLLYAGRLSREKGILDLPVVLRKVREVHPDARMVIAGSGPAENELQELMPDALYLGWVDKAKLAELYTSLDLFVFPSRFDTFGNVVLEAFSYGMPVVAYDCKGPKDIIQDGVSGYLVDDEEQMSRRIAAYLGAPGKHPLMRQNAIKRSDEYRAVPIMTRFLDDLGLPVPKQYTEREDLSAA